jgi:selenocysteine lyase/cysteine desulfurase
MILASQRDKFSLPRDLCYLNAAYMTPQTLKMQEIGAEAVARRARPWTITEADFFTDVETLRTAFARLIGAEADDVAIIPAVSYGIAVAARNLKLDPGRAILMLDDQFPSNVYSWMRLAEEHRAKLLVAERQMGEDWADAVLRTAREAESEVQIFALPQVHWADGVPVDIERVAELVRESGAQLVLDVTQSLGAMPFNIEGIDPDYVITAGYKWLFCPYGVSFLYLAERHHDGVPLEENWVNRIGSEDFSGLVQYEPRYLPGGRRFDMGERAQFAQLPMAIEALRQIAEWGTGNIAETLAAYNLEIAEIFAPYGFTAAGQGSPHLMGLGAREELPADLAGRLAAAGVKLSVRGRAVRISPHVYNDAADLEQLARALKATIGRP